MYYKINKFKYDSRLKHRIGNSKNTYWYIKLYLQLKIYNLLQLELKSNM